MSRIWAFLKAKWWIVVAALAATIAIVADVLRRRTTTPQPVRLPDDSVRQADKNTGAAEALEQQAATLDSSAKSLEREIQPTAPVAPIPEGSTDAEKARLMSERIAAGRRRL